MESYYNCGPFNKILRFSFGDTLSRASSYRMAVPKPQKYAIGLITDDNKHRHQNAVTVSDFKAKVGRQNNAGHNVNDFSS